MKKTLSLLLAAALLLSLCACGGSAPGSTGAPICYLDNGVFYVLDTNGKVLSETETKADHFETKRSLSPEKFVVKLYRDSYYWDGAGLQKMPGLSPFDGLISMDGSAVAYHDYPNYPQRDLILQRKDGRNLTSTTIEGDCDDVHLRCISPDGTSVGYTLAENGGNTGYVFHSGEKIKLGENKYPVAVSKDCRYIYYIKMESGARGSLYVQSGSDNESRTRIGSEFSCEVYLEGSNHFPVCEYYVYFNRDGAEAIALVGGETFLCKGNAAVEKLSDHLLYPIVPNQYSSVILDNVARDSSYLGGVLSASVFFPWIDSFSACPLFEINDSTRSVDILRLRGDKSLEKLVSSVSIEDDRFNVQLSTDMKKIIYLDGDVLYRYSIEKDQREKLAGEAVSFTASEDGTTIFYVNKDHEVYRKVSDERLVLLTDDTGTAWDCTYNWEMEPYGAANATSFYGLWILVNSWVSGDVLFYGKGDTLYQFGEKTATHTFNEEISYWRPSKNAVTVVTKGDSYHQYISVCEKDFIEVTDCE